MSLLGLSCCTLALIFGYNFINTATAADCSALAVTRIADELDTVPNWETLAGWLDVKQGKIDGIEFNCKGKGGNVAECCRSMLVRTYCESLKSGTVKDVVENIAEALEKMGKNLQASRIRKLDLGSEDDELGTGPVPPPVESESCSSDDPHCSKTSTKSSISNPNWEDDEPEEWDLELIKYKDSKGEKTLNFRLLQDIQHHCRAIGIRLGIKKQSLEAYEKKHDHDPIEVCLEVFHYWSTAGVDKYPYTWGSIMILLEDVQLKGIAVKLKKALENKVA